MKFTFVTPYILNEEPRKEDFKEFHGFERKVAFRSAMRAYLRTRAAEAQNWKCCYCGIYMSHGEKKKRTRDATLEHIVPQSMGGTDDPENCAAACFKCNSKRGNMCYNLFMERLADKTISSVRTGKKRRCKVRTFKKKIESLNYLKSRDWKSDDGRIKSVNDFRKFVMHHITDEQREELERLIAA